MAGNVLEFTDSNFQQEVLESTQPVLVDFWAEWCGPCKMLTPTIEALANDFQGKVRIGKINIDHHPNQAANYGVSAIPALLVFKDGQVVKSLTGLAPKDKLSTRLNSVL